MIVLAYLISLLNLQPPTSNLRQEDIIFNKLIGSWQRSNSRIQEKWAKKPDGSYFSVMYRVNGADTTLIEEVNTTREGKIWVYAVKGADNPGIVRFPSVEAGPNRVHFANPSHDFPTDIVYELLDPTHIKAYIVGPNDKGGKDTVWFNFTKIEP